MDKSLETVAQRWIELDKALGSMDGLNIKSLAKHPLYRSKSATAAIRKVYRDLVIFEKVFNVCIERDPEEKRLRYSAIGMAVFTTHIPKDIFKAASSLLHAIRNPGKSGKKRRRWKLEEDE